MNKKVSDDQITTEVFPLIWSDDVAALVDWAVAALGLKESWRAAGEDGRVEHAEVHWFTGKVSINISRGERTGPSGISLRGMTGSRLMIYTNRQSQRALMFPRVRKKVLLPIALQQQIKTVTNGG